MATGGHHGSCKEIQQNGEASNNTNSVGNRSLQWTLLPNNLELNARSKPAKKQRNKDKTRGAVSADNLASVNPVNRSSSSNFLDRCFQSLSDADNPPPATKRNLKASVNQRYAGQGLSFQGASTSRSAIENENMPTSKEIYSKKQPDSAIIAERRGHLKDCLAQVTSVLQHLEQSDEPNEALTNCEDPEQGTSTRSSFSSKVSDGAKREINGGLQYTEEDKANIQNHLLEKMKASQEKLTVLRQQQSVLLTMHRKAEDRLAAFQAELAKSSADMSHTGQDYYYQPESGACASEETIQNGDIGWEKDNADSQLQLFQQNTQKLIKNEQRKFQESGWKDPQDLAKLHVNLDHIKRRLELLQQISDNRNVDVAVSPTDVQMLDDNQLGQTVAAVEWQRKKLKNKLLELMEKKKASDELLKELTVIKEAANAEIFKESDAAFSLSNIQDVPMLASNEEGERTLDDLQETIYELRDLLNNSNSSQDTTAKKNPHGNPSAKRDNIRKEQRDQFPARRHYEAEGRANEDPDVPAASAAIAVTPSPDPNAWENDLKVQEKKKELEKTKQKLHLMQELVQSIQVAKASGQQIPASYLQAMASLSEARDDDDFEDAETATDNEESQENDDSSSVVDTKSPEMSPSKVNEATNDVSELLRRADDTERSETDRGDIDEEQNLEAMQLERASLAKLHQKFLKMRHKFSSSPKQNNEEIRYSGEGGILHRKKPRPGHPVPSHQGQQRQDNLLTRQNVESQNRNNSSGVARVSTSIKKDNINDLSAKLSKSCVRSSARPSDLSKFNANSSLFSVDMNQSLSLRDEIHNKSPVELLLNKQDRSKPQNLSRIRDIRSNSSVNSEPLDGSGSALAPDTTAAATWGGSSTQENFEDENEPTESLEEQGEEESISAEGARNILEVEPTTAAFSKSYSADQAYANYSVTSSVKRRDNRLNKYFKSTELNQWNPRGNLVQPELRGQRIQPLAESSQCALPEEPHGQAEDESQTSASSIPCANPLPVPDRFKQQLQQQLDKLNALCRPVLQDSLPSASSSAPQVAPVQPSRGVERNPVPPTTFQYPTVSNSCRTTQAVSDVMNSYTQQLHLQQQLLLSLSQCYHALYMQQLEIQHLHRCMQQGIDPEVPYSSQPTPSAPATEDFTFRPWFPSSWQSGISAVPFPPGQISPLSAPPFLQAPQPAFSFSPNVAPSNSATSAAPCALVTGVQPARAVVHPAAQDNRPGSETLNNQVPPRTRANNFWDNFRSYSRQNLLSTSNVTKSKDSGASGGPQVRQVHPLIPNESSYRSRVFIPPHTEGNAASAAQTADRSYVRPVGNPEYQEVVNRSKKPNTSRQQVAANQPLLETSSTVHTVGNASAFSMCTETDQSSRSNLEDVQTRGLSSTENQSARCVKCMKSSKMSATSQPLPDAIQSEMSKLLAQNNNRSDHLEELLRELRNLKSDSLLRAVNAVRELASTESRENHVSGSVRTYDNESQGSQGISRDRSDLSEEHDGASSSPSASGASDFHNFRSANENVVQRSNQMQNWAPATIIPLGKYVPKPSTGAVKKRSIRDTVPSGACAWTSSPSSSPAAVAVAAEAQAVEEKVPPSTSRGDSLEALVERVIFDAIPFIQTHIMDECNSNLRSIFTAKVIEALKNHFSWKLTPEFLIQLHQALMQMMNKYSNYKWCECEADLLKNAATTLYRELSLYKSMSLRASLEEICEHSTAVPKKNPQPDVLPISSRSFCEKNKQIIPNKDKDVQEDSVAVLGNSFFANSPLQEFENHVGELYINMPTEDSALPSHYNTSAQSAVGGACPQPASNWQCQQGNVEEEMGYECDPEAEGEPEVEAGTEADLAEADQSPGQQTAGNSVIPPVSWHASQAMARATTTATVEQVSCTESGGAGDAACALAIGVQVSSSASADKEITLDDIPTKLTAMSQDELQKQIADEQETNALLLEVVEDLSLAGDGECPKDPPAFI